MGNATLQRSRIPRHRLTGPPEVCDSEASLIALPIFNLPQSRIFGKFDSSFRKPRFQGAIVSRRVGQSCRLADLIHGQHNGDVHRFYIHIVEFVAFLGVFGLLAIEGFRLIKERFDLDRWLAGVCLSFVSFLEGFTVFALAGGSVHGDGGPIAVSFALIGLIGMIGIPISIVGFLVALLMRKHDGSSVS
jgi:hypothetical protein